MRSSKGSRRIVVNDIEYRWRATGDDGFIRIAIWPSNNVGAFIHGNIGYYERWIAQCDGSAKAVGGQLVITNRIIRRVIDHAITAHGYDPSVKATELNLKSLDFVIRWDDAVRSPEKPT